MRRYWSAADPCTHVIVSDDGCFVAGPRTTTVQRPVRPGVRSFGIRLQLGSARALLHLPPTLVLRDTRHRLRRVPWLAALAEWGSGLDLRDDFARLSASADDALDRLVGRAAATDPAVEQGLARLQSEDVAVSRIDDIALDLGLSARQFRRRFLAAVDLTPREYRRLLRFRRCVHALMTAPRVGWSARAAESGFADQSHLIREFRRLGSLAPAEFERRLRNVIHRRPWSPGPPGSRTVASHGDETSEFPIDQE